MKKVGALIIKLINYILPNRYMIPILKVKGIPKLKMGAVVEPGDSKYIHTWEYRG